MRDPGLVELVRVLRDEIRELRGRQDDHDRRLNNLFREAKVTKVDGEKATAEVEADGLPSMAVPWLARAGKQKEWDPVTEGERVILISPTGDPGQGLILPGGFSDKFKQPHDKLGEHKRTVGDDVSVTTTDKSRTTKTKKVTVTVDEAVHTVQAEATTLTTDGKKVVADASLFRATRKTILASG